MHHFGGVGEGKSKRCFDFETKEDNDLDYKGRRLYVGRVTLLFIYIYTLILHKFRSEVVVTSIEVLQLGYFLFLLKLNFI